MSVPRSQASQASPLQQYLDTLLSHRGLPYQEGLKPSIRSHLFSLLREFPSLQVKIEAFSHSDGSPPFLLLQLGGTIPILFLQVLYNIPLVIWLSHGYPSSAPLVFLSPSPFMIIKTSHPLVDPSGSVSSPLLHSWVFPTSTLVDLVRSLCVAFGQDPPLYSVMHPPHAHGVEFSMASPLPTSTVALSTSTSLLGPGLSLEQYPLHANAARVFMSPRVPSAASTSQSLLGPGSFLQRWPSHGHATTGHQMSSTSQPSSTSQASSTSQLGPGSLLQRWPSHGHVAAGLQTASTSQPSSSGVSSSLQRYSSHPHGPGVYHLPAASSSSTSAGSCGPLPSAQQHAFTIHGGGVSMAPSTSVSLLGPGKVSQSHPSDGAGRRTVLTNLAPPLISGSSNRPSSYSSDVYDVRMAVAHHPPPPPLSSSSTFTSTSHPASLLGPGKVQGHPPHDARILSAHPSMSATSALLIGSGGLGQWHPLHTRDIRVSLAELPTASTTTSTSASLLGSGSLSQWHPPHTHVEVSMVRPSQPSTSISLLVPDTLSQQHGGVNHAHDNPCSSTMSSNPAPLIHMSQYTGPSHNHVYAPNQYLPFLNLLSGMTELSCETRQNAMDTLIGRLECDVGEMRKAKEMDMLKLMDMEALLKQRRGCCDKGIQELQQQKENLEVKLQTLLVNTEFLETWLAANNKSKMEIDIDDVFKPSDGLSNQLLECTASDLVIEDALYCLEKAAQEGIIPVDSYLRHVRTLSREQFFHRAIALKLSATQGQ